MGKKRRRVNRRAGRNDRPTRASSVCTEEEWSRIYPLWEEKRWHEVVEEAERLVERRPRDVRLHLALATSYSSLGLDAEAFEHLELAGKLEPLDPFVDFVRFGVYVSMGMDAHALRAARRYLAACPDGEQAGTAGKVVAVLEAGLAKSAARLGVTAKRMEQGALLAEEGRLANERGDLAEDLRCSQEASRMVPRWPVPRNGVAMAQYHLGKVDEAIATEEYVLAELDPDNMCALANLARIHASRGEMDRAETYARRLQGLTPASYEECLMKAHAFIAVKWDQAVYDTLVKARPSTPAAVENREWLLGVAAANLNQSSRAKFHLRRANVEVNPFRSAVANLIRRGLPGPRGRYPYVNAALNLPHREVRRLLEQTSKRADKAEQRARDLVSRYPAMMDMAAESLWLLDDEVAEEVVAFLKMVGSEEAQEILRSFASGRVGSDNARICAAKALASLEPGSAGERVTVMVQGRPTQMQVRQIQVVPARESNYPPEIEHLLRQAIARQREHRDEKAEQLYQEILAKDKNVKEALGNLAVLYFARGEIARGRDCIQKALEVDPLYVTARANLASILLADGKVDEAEKVLDPLSELTEVSSEEMVRYLATLGMLAAAKGHYEQAKKHLKLALELDPESQWVKSALEEVEWDETRDGLGDVFEHYRQRYRERKQKVPIDPGDSLVSLLGRYPKEALLGMARELSLGITSALKKDAVISAIHHQLLDTEALLGALQTLTNEERAALRYVVEAGGVVPLADFAQRYGDDGQESPYWNWHRPESVLGRLKVRGLVFEGTYQGQVTLIVPSELMQAEPGLAALVEQAGRQQK